MRPEGSFSLLGNRPISPHSIPGAQSLDSRGRGRATLGDSKRRTLLETHQNRNVEPGAS